MGRAAQVSYRRRKADEAIIKGSLSPLLGRVIQDIGLIMMNDGWLAGL